MNHLTANPAALTTFARIESDIAATVTTLADRERTDLASLAPTFGIIGAAFLTAAQDALTVRHERLTTLAATHTAIAAQTAQAERSYIGVDTTGERELSL